MKYTLGKRDAGIDELPLKRNQNEIRFDGNKLGLDNWFSSIQYFRVNQIVDAVVVVVKVVEIVDTIVVVVVTTTTMVSTISTTLTTTTTASTI